ncbi:phytoene synthase [Actinomadura rubrobrunea]|uniref:Phytoene synthase n=2 Tax=Actinomadura rubrobrunea TaxID=115335 RepID=A0A9W6Q245_9ACTN|nr:squalene synthase HpnC [Actinomadura rubrobrunea]GLW66852.1 phytoene synthase [Actinomadura rubrobrunea]
MDEFARRENFPVATRLLPARHRTHLLAVYRYARFVDDIGDRAPARERKALLDEVEADLRRLYDGGAPELPPLAGLAATVRDCRIPAEPLHRLIEANRQDQTVTRYGTFDDLVAYCALSADPVGRIVLHIFDAVTPDRVALSDRVCTALQIIEHCQDVGEDYRRGRIYLPQDDLRRFGCVERDLAAADTPTRLRGVIALQVARARRLLDEGAALVGAAPAAARPPVPAPPRPARAARRARSADPVPPAAPVRDPGSARLPGFARIAVAGYIAGGRAALAAIERRGYDVLADPPRPARTRLLIEWSRMLGRR